MINDYEKENTKKYSRGIIIIRFSEYSLILINCYTATKEERPQFKHFTSGSTL